MFKKKPKSGWEKNQQKKITKPRKESQIFFSNVLIKPIKQNKIIENIVKFIIWISLRTVISNKKWKSNRHLEIEVVDSAYSKITSNEFKYIPAGLGMYLFIAFMPILTIVFAILSFNKSWSDFLSDEILVRIIPGVSSSIPKVSSFFQNKQGLVTLSILFVSSLLMSSKGISAFISSQSTIYGQKAITIPFLNRLRAIAIVLFVPVYIVICLSIYIPILIAIKDSLGNENKIYFLVIFYIITFFSFSISAFIGFLFLFKFSPRFKLKFKHIYPGAFISTFTITIFFLIFGFLISLSKLEKTYGVIGTFMYLTTLLFYSAFFIYIGLITNASYYHVFISKKIINKGLGKRYKFMN